jgi:tetratricopeptide (TPR) repeat protein
MAKLPGFAPPSRGPSVRDQTLQEAVIALQMQRPDQAERIVAEVLKASRNDPRALQILGQALVLQGRAGEAVERLERAARRSEDPALETHLAIALRAAGRGDEAINVLHHAISRRPAYPAAFLELNQQLLALGRHDEAIDMLKRGVALLPEVAELPIQLGYLYAARNDRKNAGALLRQGLALAPERLDALFALAHTLQMDGAFTEAADMYRRCLGHNPDNAEARIGLGVCLLELREVESGADNIRRAMRSSNPKMFGQGLATLAGAAHGRFWLRPSDAARFVRGEAGR